jgi:rhodanese-related sulfurtransferase
MKKSRFVSVLAASLLSVATVNSYAISGEGLAEKKQTSLGFYLNAEEAHKMKSEHQDVLFIDVRTRAEVAFLGMPVNADANIPYVLAEDFSSWSDKKKTFKFPANSEFQMAVDSLVSAKGLKKDSKIIVMCRSGSRSAKAANLLAKVGYTNVYTVVDGYEGDKAKKGTNKGQRVVNGWKNAGLPWSYKLDKQKMYGDMND